MRLISGDEVKGQTVVNSVKMTAKGQANLVLKHTMGNKLYILHEGSEEVALLEGAAVMGFGKRVLQAHGGSGAP